MEEARRLNRLEAELAKGDSLRRRSSVDTGRHHLRGWGGPAMPPAAPGAAAPPTPGGPGGDPGAAGPGADDPREDAAAGAAAGGDAPTQLQLQDALEGVFGPGVPMLEAPKDAAGQPKAGGLISKFMRRKSIGRDEPPFEWKVRDDLKTLASKP